MLRIEKNQVFNEKTPNIEPFWQSCSLVENHGVFSKMKFLVVADFRPSPSKRNNIHLYASFGESWEDKVNQETQILDSIERLFNFSKIWILLIRNYLLAGRRNWMFVQINYPI